MNITGITTNSVLTAGFQVNQHEQVSSVHLLLKAIGRTSGFGGTIM